MPTADPIDQPDELDRLAAAPSPRSSMRSSERHCAVSPNARSVARNSAFARRAGRAWFAALHASATTCGARRCCTQLRRRIRRSETSAREQTSTPTSRPMRERAERRVDDARAAPATAARRRPAEAAGTSSVCAVVPAPGTTRAGGRVAGPRGRDVAEPPGPRRARARSTRRRPASCCARAGAVIRAAGLRRRASRSGAGVEVGLSIPIA